MRIRIAEGEEYTFNVPEDITLDEFNGLVSRMNGILKMLTKAGFTDIMVTSPVSLMTRTRKPQLTEEAAIAVMKEYYGTVETRRALLQRDRHAAGIVGRWKHLVAPEKVGLKAYPKMGQRENWQELKL